MRSISLSGRTLTEIRPGIWRLEPSGKMRVGVHFIASAPLLEQVKDDLSIQQAANVATLPGVVDPVLTMPDIHQGYGFPIGGVAAFSPKTGVVSPGGVGYDINCGVRLLTTSLARCALAEKKLLRGLVNALFENVPCGVGSRRADLSYSPSEFKELLSEGAAWAVKRGLGETDDLECIEERGKIPGADPGAVSARAIDRGFDQLGTLGSGNHFIEIQYVDEIYDEEKAAAFGLEKDQVTVSIHTGSRGLGYQVCADYLDTALEACRRYGIELVDRGLAAAPLDSDEGKSYLKAMGAAANFAFANRQLITHWVRESFKDCFGGAEKIRLLYDVCHNIAKFEELPVGKGLLRVCVHRKGATRAYGPKHPSLPSRFRESGQPILVPGDMGRYSFVLAGSESSLSESFGSACHGAGRELSRSAAKKLGHGRAIARELEDKGILVRSAGRNTVLEEMPEAYKDVHEVVSAVATAKIATVVAKLKPVGVVKG